MQRLRRFVKPNLSQTLLRKELGTPSLDLKRSTVKDFWDFTMKKLEKLSQRDSIGPAVSPLKILSQSQAFQCSIQMTCLPLWWVSPTAFSIKESQSKINHNQTVFMLPTTSLTTLTCLWAILQILQQQTDSINGLMLLCTTLYTLSEIFLSLSNTAILQSLFSSLQTWLLLIGVIFQKDLYS